MSTAQRTSRYDTHPAIDIGQRAILSGPDAWSRLRQAANRPDDPVLVIDTYPGVDLPALLAQLRVAFPDHEVIDVERAARPIEDIDAMIAANLSDDRVFGVMSHVDISAFYDADALADIAGRTRGRRCVLAGWGAALVPIENRVLVLADMARWEIQRRYRAGAPNWRCHNASEDTLLKYKRGFFVEWRVADRHKMRILDDVDYFLDLNSSIADAHLVTAETWWYGIDQAASRPFRVVPFFDPGVWGGQWMKQVCGLPEDQPNYAWCFDCVPEENSLLLRSGSVDFELPSLDLVLTRPRQLLGDKTFARFGPEFPIRFDFLDTMGGGNLSLQVHPLTGYIQDTFGMHYTQDESYYLLDAGPNAVVYLGLQEGVNPQQMACDLRSAQAGEMPFPADTYVNRIHARKHDHFSIPAGTIHCSGQDSMVLEISATPYIFTFKLWDWGRVGMDGVPRPIHIEHGLRNIQWDRDTEWVQTELLQGPDKLDEGPGWREERTGLHELEFIETRRHWFESPVTHHTRGTVNVLNLVHGDAATVSSPTGAFAPMDVHYAETFIVPASVGPYQIEPASGGECATVKASVRGTERPL